MKPDNNLKKNLKPPFTLKVSYDYGNTYSAAFTSANIEDFKIKCSELDKSFIRWVREDSDGNDSGLWCAVHAGHAAFI